MWNAGKVTDTECEGRQRDAYNQRHLATRLTPIPMRLRHCNDSATSKYRNNSNNTAKCECSAMYSYYDGLSASLCVLIDGLSALRDLIMMVSAFAMQASTTYSEASAPQSPIWFRPATRFGTRYGVSLESQRARIRVTELVWALRVPNTAGGAFCSRLVCMSTCMGCTREGGVSWKQCI